MKKQIRLTERDLTRIVRRVINEGVCISDPSEKDLKDLARGEYQGEISTQGNGNCFKVTINGITYGLNN
jgi:hypothetical protein